MTKRTAPRVENAPGIVWRKRKVGWAAMWHARTDLIMRGWRPRSLRVALVSDEPTEEECAYISSECQRLQDDMLVFARGGIPLATDYDGSVGSLVRCYQTDLVSTYRKVRFVTRRSYDALLRRIIEDRGHEMVRDIKARQLLTWHEGWLSRGIPMAHSLVNMMRTLAGFGMTVLECPECTRVRTILRGLKFQNGERRKEALSAEQATAIRAKAHEMGFPAIALVQAFQFECTFRQKDVIGEWVPQSEKVPSDVLNMERGEKWLRGIRWQEINNDLILRHVTSKKNKEVVIDLKLAPMVLEELRKLGDLPDNGPVIIEKATGLPYRAPQFRKDWRTIARAAGVPDEVFNMDSRAGAITEATDSGAELEMVRHAATHSNISMTQAYSRGSEKKVANVMQMRVASRNKTGT